MARLPALGGRPTLVPKGHWRMRPPPPATSAERPPQSRRGVDPGGYFHVASLSTETIVYKGLLLPAQLPNFYRDLADEADRFRREIADRLARLGTPSRD